MTYRTHKQYSIAFSYIALMILYTLKLFNFSYYLCFPIILLVGQWGAKFPDLDHNFANIKDKNVLTWCISKLIHITGGKHRSWQTHSWDICVIYSVVTNLLIGKYLNEMDSGLAFLINCGFIAGWISHLVADMFNGVGVRIVCWSKKTVAFVPRKLFGIHFNTGGDWEIFNYKVMRMADVIFGLIALVYPFMEQIKYILKL